MSLLYVLLYVILDDGQYSDNKSETSSSTRKSTSSSRSPTPSKIGQIPTSILPTTAGVGSLTIPEFSTGVRSCLLEGKSNEVWGNVIDELVTYYTRKYPDRLKTSEDYQIVGKMIIKTYPYLERFGIHPWVSFY